ncbi:37S ribosomal protein S9 [Penicillium alfredii]|uniref:Small ribosomal subunit protein uS9m n=1 Tax=Penicillium alfredii TaxID=1506179 RepID=A0A9W9F2D2_9EURO|nr:37S ribosomal protein S9 [Penicillium alfredii]KAJ5092337.1 37S ribosomal protein S9 [Penicillium alfredii]
MACRSPPSLIQAMQSLRLGPSVSCLAAQPAYLSRPRRQARSYMTDAVDGTETSEAADMSVMTDVNQVKAAPPIKLQEINPGNPNVQGLRIVPASPAYFSGNPRFIDQMLELETIQARYAALPTILADDAPRMAWLKIGQLREHLGEIIPVKKYKALLKILQRLNRIKPEMQPDEVRSTIETFVRPGNPFAVQHVPRPVDEHGRARGKGKRKESSAVVQLVEGEGEIIINGKSLVDVFHRVHDRESALWALRCTQRIDKYNAWITVRGGGLTGQAEAITLAMARALLLHEPGLKPILRKAGVVTVDARRVERKKPGRVKARKMPTWVKR